jgi:hypothetical protein
MGALRPPVEEERLRAEIGRYDPEDAARVRDRVRSEAGRGQAVEILAGLYRELLAMPRADAQDCLRAASHYLRWLGPHMRTAEDDLARTAAELAAAEHRLAEAHAARQALERSPFLRLRASLLGLAPLVAAYRVFNRAIKGWRGA